MRFLIIVLTILIAPFSQLSSQAFYDLNTIQTIEINFVESNWDALLDAQKAGDEDYIMAQSVTINGEVFDSVGVKYKGNSTYNANQTKNPFHIELDTYKDHKYETYTDIKLSNVAKDPSFVREVLSYQILRQYMDAPLSNYANVYVNGNLLGLYSNSESVSKKFVNNRFYSKTNAFIKCNPPAGAGPGSNDFPNLVYMGQDSTDYYDAYEIKSDDDYGWGELINLCDTLTNHTEAIEDILDVDRALWMLAFNNVLVNLDSYIGAFAQNYYLYRADNGRFLPIVWDLNESFGGFSLTGSGNLNTAQKQQMSHLLNQNDSDFPLVQKLLNVPMYKRMYIAHCKTMLQENFENGTYLTTGQTFQNLIDDAVQADGNKFYTYANFLNNLTDDISGGGGGPGGGGTIGISNLMEVRSAYLLGLSDFTQTEPSIGNVEVSNALPAVNETINITANINDENVVYLGYRFALDAPFTRIEMFDDGTHNDGAANDGIYGVELQLASALTQYYIYAENSTIGKFSPQRAEHEYYEITASSPSPVVGDLVINEFMASNDATAVDQDGEFEDWIELYNNGSEIIDLTGYFLTDDPTDLKQWEFPAGTSIEPDAYLIIWADDDTDQEGLHANFKLSSSAESVVLTDASATNIIDEINYIDQTADISYSRIPNGTGDFEATAPTFNANNNVDINECVNNGGDADNDGICADIDCNDNNAEVGAQETEGTSCDDGDLTTVYDLIQADGCTCQGITITLSDLVINEFMASNDTTVTDQDEEFEDWIELYNNGSETIDLSGFYLSDDGEDLTQWEFPTGTIIEPDAYLIIWADDDTGQDGLHANFKLSGSGETIYLVAQDGNTIVDAVSYAEQTADVSYSRIPNGTGDFQSTEPTFNANNGFVNTSNINLETIGLKAFPNPAINKITITADYLLENIAIFNLTGKKVLQLNANQKEVFVSLINVPSGMYLVQATTGQGEIVSFKIIVENE